jgi:MEMO1 family protein
MEHEQLLRIVYDAIEAHLSKKAFQPPELPSPWDVARPVFVTLRTAEGNLRGCIGHLQATRSSLADEIANDAVSAAIRDTRFKPVTAAELPSLQFSISILGEPEPVADVAELDCKVYGVIVAHKGRRGGLLPDIQGVDSVEEQIRIARRKGGIAEGEDCHISRFIVTKIS